MAIYETAVLKSNSSSSWLVLRLCGFLLRPVRKSQNNNNNTSLSSSSSSSSATSLWWCLALLVYAGARNEDSRAFWKLHYRQWRRRTTMTTAQDNDDGTTNNNNSSSRRTTLLAATSSTLLYVCQRIVDRLRLLQKVDDRTTSTMTLHTGACQCGQATFTVRVVYITYILVVCLSVCRAIYVSICTKYNSHDVLLDIISCGPPKRCILQRTRRQQQQQRFHWRTPPLTVV